MEDEFAIGAILGTFLAGITVIILVLIFWPSGDESVIKDCLSDKPNICRTITTYTTPYKEEH